MKKLVARFALALGIVTGASGCAFNIGQDDTLEPVSARPVNAADWPQSKVFFRRFVTQTVIGRSVAMASGPGGMATASGETVGTSSEVSTEVLTAAQKSFPFDAISTMAGMGEPPKYILEGSLTYDWYLQWWTLVQLVDLWIHAWFLPTLGRYLEMDFELNLYDADQRLLRSWTGKRVDKFIGNIWWGISHGGSGGSGHEKMYFKYLDEVFAAVGEDMRACVEKSRREGTSASATGGE